MLLSGLAMSNQSLKTEIRFYVEYSDHYTSGPHKPRCPSSSSWSAGLRVCSVSCLYNGKHLVANSSGSRFRGRTPGRDPQATPPQKQNRGETATPRNPRSGGTFLNAAKASTPPGTGSGMQFSSPASKILQQVWEDENPNDLGLNNASLTWASGQAEVGGQGSAALGN